jgi:hypothetical protein
MKHWRRKGIPDGVRSGYAYGAVKCGLDCGFGFVGQHRSVPSVTDSSLSGAEVTEDCAMTQESAGRTANGIVVRLYDCGPLSPSWCQSKTPHLRQLLHLWVGIRSAPGILLSNVARIALFALASCTRWPSVVCFAVLTQAGMCDTS